MNDRTKKIVIFLGTLFVAVSFITSYGALSSTGTPATSSTTTAPSARTFFVSGNANAVLVGYSQSATLLYNKSINSTASNQIIATLSNLEKNGSINNYIQLGNSFQVLLANMNAYNFEQLLYAKLNSNTSTTVNASSIVQLPYRITLSLGGTAVPVILTQRNYTINVLPLRPIGSSVKVLVSALVTNNGTVYNNQITVKQSA